MKVLRSLVGALLLVWSAVPAGAQSPTGTVAGQITDRSTGQPIAGVEVQVVGTSLRTLSDNQGRYLVTQVPAGEHSIRASMLGYAAARQTVTVTAGGTAAASFAMETTALEVEGIVVTALGMERQARTLGVSTEQLNSAELSRAEVNLVNTLSGQVAGVHVTNSGPQGGSTRIVIRGENSITGNNEPLFVVDGIPVNNSTGIGGLGGTTSDQGGFDYGNAIQDINPDNIESITVLKGPNAAALYGSRASNGAVIITTKKGRSATSGDIVVSQILTFEDELRLPRYQNEYGQGLAGRFEYYDGYGNGVYDEVDESWGPPLDVGLLIPQWDSPLDPVTGERVPTPWVSHPDNVDQFFDVGMTATTNVSVAGANERMNGRLGFSRMALDGMVPGFELERTALSFAGAMGITDRLDVTTSAQYVTSEGENRPGVGYGEDNPMSQFIWFGRQVDTRELERRYQQVRPEGDPMAGLPYSWNTLFHPNPYFLQLENRNTDGRDRLFGQVALNYEIASWLTGLVRTGTDWYQDARLKAYAYNPQIELSGYYTTNPVTAGREYLTNNGGFGQWEIGFQETNSEFLLNATPNLGLPVSTAFMFGGNRRDVESNFDYTWVGELATPGIYDISNAAGTPNRNTFLARQRVNSLYGQAEFGYNDFLFLTATGRNDWSSTLPEANRSYFYPSVSGSFVFSDLLPLGGLLSYGKLRSSWALVGNDTNPYSLRNTFIADEIWEGVPSFTVPGQLANAELKPETTESVEVGTELAFLDNRFGLDLTYYTEETRNQIMPVQLSRGTGYASRLVNAGTVQNNGFEVLVRATPVRSDRFSWETSVTWAKNNSEVVELAEGVEGLELGLGNFWGVSLYARQGEPLGQLVGPGYQRDPNGNIIVSASSGAPLASTAPQVIGNVNPDWRASWGNELGFGPARLRFLFDGKMGGDVFSVTSMFGTYAGVLEETLAGRCTPAGSLEPGEDPPAGYPICDAQTGIVVDGVNRVVNGTDTTYVQNTTVIDAATYWAYMYGVKEAHVVDGSFVKLRDLTLSYDVPTTLSSRLGLNGVEVTLIGRNLWLWSKADHIDPETSMESSNQQGFEYGQMPSPRSFGFNITVRP